MLQIKNICKTYKTGPFVQKALNDVSLSLRDNEFVAILGQSGSGKTTLLNVIGGLDHYDSGDLIINGVSTKKYKSRDWDAYRNHSVGFVFQSYNLIPHQTILSNVELALTIGGVSRSERTERAKEALGKVGLGEHIHKKPSQLSGGQMQRVAIARALVNDPKILLADEPTGALDSETSIQVMDLLKEVAKDRLVVMVTHNPELAEEYATRIVRLQDGHIISDNDPYEPESEEAEHKNFGKTSMSFLTALNLSLNNLWTKKVRTLLVAFAGSIGIIGIAMILSLSNGANNYIKDTEENTLKSYPLTITSSGMDFSSLISDTASEVKNENQNAEVREWNMVTKMFSKVTSNDLKSLRTFIEDKDTKIYSNAQAIEYKYNVTPYIYTLNGDEYRQVNPDTSMSQLGFTSQNSMNSLMSAWSSTDCFSMLPENDAVYKDQYELKAGKWPEKYNECVMVLTKNGRVSDLTLYAIGIKNPKTLDKIISSFAQGSSYKTDTKSKTFKYKDFIGKEFRLLPSAKQYTYEKSSKSWVNRSDDEKYMLKQVKKAETIRIVGVVKPAEDSDTALLTEGICYPAEMVKHLMELAEDEKIVKEQKNNPKVNVLTGKKFGDKSGKNDFDFFSLFSFNEDSIKDLFNFDAGSFDFSSIDFSKMDFSDFNLSDMMKNVDLNMLLPELSEADISELISSVKINISQKDAEKQFDALLKDYLSYATDDTSNISQLSDTVSDYFKSDSLAELLSDELSAAIGANNSELMTTEEMRDTMLSVLSGFEEYAKTIKLDSNTSVSQVLNDYLNTQNVKDKLSKVTNNINSRLHTIEFNAEQLQKISSSVYEGYNKYVKKNNLPSLDSTITSFSDYLKTDEAKKLISSTITKAVDTSELEKKITKMLGDNKQMSSIMSAFSAGFAEQMKTAMVSLVTQLQDNLKNAFSFDKDDLKNMFGSSLTAGEMKDLFNSLLSSDTTTTLQSVYAKLGYAETENPYSIVIYPSDFDGKGVIKSEIERYNDAQKAAGKDEKVIVYTDLVDTLMSSVTQIVDAISAILIAFVAISLVVSSVMIGVITYISVLERKKEIGILRAIGASKRNISNVFNAETFIIGGLAGLLGVGITLLMIIPANYLIHTITNQYGVNASLPPVAAVTLVLLSIALTLIGGIIPSRKAAHSDPVTALRSE